jgi:hypothetical protein
VIYDFSVTQGGEVSYLRRERPLLVQREYYSGPRFAH